MTRTGVATLALLGWAAAASAQQAASSSVSVLTRGAFYLNAQHLGGSDDRRFSWDADFGGELDLIEFTKGRFIFAANYEAILGDEKQKFDPNQGNYILEGALSARLKRIEAFAVFHHQSRHLGDREKDQPVDWNMLGGRVATSFLVNGTYFETRADLRWTTEVAFVDYDWELDTFMRADRLIRPGMGVFGAGGVRYLGVDGTAGRGNQTGYLAQGGFRVEGSGAALELFAGVERRIDPYPLEFGTATWMVAGFRLTSR